MRRGLVRWLLVGMMGGSGILHFAPTRLPLQGPAILAAVSVARAPEG